MRHLLILLLIIQLLFSCSASQRMAEVGLFEKRKHHPGRHVDLGPAIDATSTAPVMRSTTANKPPLDHVKRDQTSTSQVIPAAARSHQTVGKPMARPARTRTGAHAQVTNDGPAFASSTLPVLAATASTEPDREKNDLASLGFFIALFGIIAGLFNAAFMLLLIPATIMGIIALFQIAHRQERGLGFALVAAFSLLLYFAILLALASNSGN